MSGGDAERGEACANFEEGNGCDENVSEEVPDDLVAVEAADPLTGICGWKPDDAVNGAIIDEGIVLARICGVELSSFRGRPRFLFVISPSTSPSPPATID